MNAELLKLSQKLKPRPFLPYEFSLIGKRGRLSVLSLYGRLLRETKKFWDDNTRCVADAILFVCAGAGLLTAVYIMCRTTVENRLKWRFRRAKKFSDLQVIYEHLEEGHRVCIMLLRYYYCLIMPHF